MKEFQKKKLERKSVLKKLSVQKFLNEKLSQLALVRKKSGLIEYRGNSIGHRNNLIVLILFR